MNDDPMPNASTTELPPPPPPVSWWHVPVARDPDERKLGGVVAGLAKPFGFDLRTTRFAVVVAALALPGVTALYIAAWILLPKVPEQARSLHDIITERRRRPLLVAIALLAIFSGFGSWAFFGGVGWGVTLLGVGVVLWLSPNFGSGFRPVTAPTVTATGPDGTAARARRRRHPIQAVSLVAAFVTAMVMSLGNAANWWNASVYGTTVTVLAILIAGTIIGAIVNRSWFGIPMLVMLMALTGGLLITHPNLNGGFGDREVHPTTAGEAARSYHLGAGRLRIDLASLGASNGNTVVHAEVGYGQLRIVVPSGVTLHLITRVGAGHIVLDDAELVAGMRHEDDRVVPAIGEQTTPRTITLDLQIGGGEIRIVRAG